MRTYNSGAPLVAFFAMAYAASFCGGYLNSRWPSDWWMLCVYGPAVAALILVGSLEGASGLRAWFAGIVKWRVGILPYCVALLAPWVLQLAALGLHFAFGGLALPPARQDVWPALAFQFAMVFLVIGLGEEPGFRGYALPRLLASYSALTASLILGVLHAIWHAPLFVTGTESVAIVPIILSGAIFMTWLYERSQRSVLLPMIMHASVNTSAYAVARLVGDDAVQRHTLFLAAVYVFVAAACVVVGGSSLNILRSAPGDTAR